MGKKRKPKQNGFNYNNENAFFFDAQELNNLTYHDYLSRLSKIALSIFQWVNLPSSINPFKLERDLFYNGQASFLLDENMGYINTQCASNGFINIYDVPTDINCFAVNYNASRKVYTGLKSNSINQKTDSVLIYNDILGNPTFPSLQLFAYRLYHAEQTAFINVIAQRTPTILLTDDKQKLSLQQVYAKWEGYSPVIFGDKSQLGDIDKSLTSIKTDAPFIADKISEYKKEIWNDALTFLGVNNLMVDKKERLVSDEANSNNELINLNLQSFLAPRQFACEQFNQLFNTKNKISVRVRSDLHNIIKNEMSVIQDYKRDGELNE